MARLSPEAAKLHQLPFARYTKSAGRFSIVANIAGPARFRSVADVAVKRFDHIGVSFELERGYQSQATS